MITANIDSDPLAEFIHTHAPHLDSQITEEASLLEQGLLDSLTLMKLIAFLEHRYRLVVPENDITPENFKNLAAIRNLITSLSSLRS